MKKLIITAMCFALLVLAGCKTPPEEVPETPDVTEVKPEDTTDNTIAEANDTLMQDIVKARQMAVAAGAEEYFSDELLVVDVASTEAHAVYEDGGDEEAFNETATNVLYQYRALEQASIAAKAGAKITEMGFESYDSDGFAAGNTASEAALRLFNSGASGKEVYDEAKKAADAYNTVLFTAFTSLADEKRVSFLDVKEMADEIKAGVADSQNYNGAVVFFTQGDQDLVSKNPESAYKNFSIAADSMTTVYETVAEKRRLAQEAMDRAKRRIEDAEDVATAADTQVPLADVESLDSISEETTQEAE